MSRRLVIAIDCDDVLLETTPFLVDAYNQKFGTNVTLEHAHASNNPEWGTDDSALILARLTDLQKTDEYCAVMPHPDAILAVRELAKDHELHLITARDPSIENLTRSMLDTYLSGCFTSMEHVGKDRSKGEVCRQIHADVLIDDNIRHLVSALEMGMSAGGALHFGDYVWNSVDTVPTGVVRCGTWRDVQNRIVEIAR